MFGILTSLHNLGPMLQLIASGTLWISAAYPLIHRIHSWGPAFTRAILSPLIPAPHSIIVLIWRHLTLLSHGRSPSPSRCRCYLPLSLFPPISICITRFPFIYITPPPVHTVSSLTFFLVLVIFGPCPSTFTRPCPVLILFRFTDIPRRY